MDKISDVIAENEEIYESFFEEHFYLQADRNDENKKESEKEFVHPRDFAARLKLGRLDRISSFRMWLKRTHNIQRKAVRIKFTEVGADGATCEKWGVSHRYVGIGLHPLPEKKM
jgi:hypothetical protein